MSDTPPSSNFFRETGIATFSGATGGAASEIFALWDVPAQVICNCYAEAPQAMGRTAAKLATATADAGEPMLTLILSKIAMAVLVGAVAGTLLGGVTLFVYRRWLRQHRPRIAAADGGNKKPRRYRGS